jgi:LysM repeat protein
VSWVPSVRFIFFLLAFAAGLGAQTCTFTLTAAPNSFPLAGGSGTLQITASSNTCVRNVSASASWITIVFGQTGTGNGSAGFTVDANDSAPTRTGTITVGSQSVTINQAGPPCNFAVNPNSANVSAQAQNGSFALTGLSGCTWTASSNASFVQVNSPASGTGPATIAYTVQRGDTLSDLALRFNTTVQAIVAHNPQIDARRMRVGQVINIPAARPQPTQEHKP